MRVAFRDRSQERWIEEWSSGILEFVQDYPDLVTEEAVVERLRSEPPLAADRFHDRWLRRVFPAIQERVAPKQPSRTQRANESQQFSTGRVKL